MDIRFRLIDNCNALLNRLNGYKSVQAEQQRTELNQCLNTAMYYKKVLEDLLNLDFNNPSGFLKNFVAENKVDLKDENVQKDFFKVRDEHIEKINEFYNRNFGKMGISTLSDIGMKEIEKGKSKTTNNATSQTPAQSKQIQSNQGNSETDRSFKENKEKKQVKKSAAEIQNRINKGINNTVITSSSKNKANKGRTGWSLSFSGIVVLSILLIYYIIVDYYSYYMNSS